MLMWRLGSQSEWISCWRVGRKPTRTNMGRIVITNRDILSIFILGVWDYGQGGTSRTYHFDLDHGRKTGQSNFTCHRLG